jgi:hypothetical protein
MAKSPWDLSAVANQQPHDPSLLRRGRGRGRGKGKGKGKGTGKRKGKTLWKELRSVGPSTFFFLLFFFFVFNLISFFFNKIFKNLVEKKNST